MAVKSEIRYRGNHLKHPPNSKVLEVVGKILADIGNRLQNHKIMSSAVEYDDDENRYKITFEWEGKVFVVMNYSSGYEVAEVQEFGEGVSVTRYFESRELIEKAIIPPLLDFLENERLRSNSFLAMLNA